jgi:propanol-preferring alcohol dehydrogenase
MRAMTLPRPGPITTAPLVEREVEDPRPGPGEVLVRIAACGVCRTDLQLCEGDLRARRLPIIPGHQLVGRIEAVGEGAGWRVGDRVGAGWLASTCGVCTACRAGHENLCARAAFTGWDTDGGYAERARVRSDFAFALPEGFTELEAAPLLCGGVIGYRSLVRSRVQPGQRLGLFGFGASASLAIQVARHWGCRVFVATRSTQEQERARTLGAEWAGTYGAPMPEPLDAAITFAPAAGVAVQALGALERGGTLAINAIHLDGPLSFSYDQLWWERNVVSVANYTRADAEALLALAAKIPIRTQRTLFPLGEANRALQQLKAGAVSGAAVLVPA